MEANSFGFRPESLTNEELARYAQMQVDAGGMNVTWQAEVVKRFEYLAHEKGSTEVLKVHKK